MKKSYNNIKTPCFVVVKEKLENNLKLLKNVIDQTGCHILLAQKCFSMYETYPLIGKYLSGTTASGLYEARLGKEYMNKENHVYAAAYTDEDMPELLEICDHVIFNSFSQWDRFKELAKNNNAKCGIRINPECQTQKGHEIYDPCAPFSRMGVTKKHFREDDLDGISGLHFHTLCEQNSDDLETTIYAVEEQYKDILYKMEWLNFGGGHHITRDDYDVDKLIKCINYMKNKYNLEIYLEPGEAVALNAGYLVSTVLDVIDNNKKIAILDSSAACHMPDVLEMPYTPEIINGIIADKEKDELNKDYKYEYRFAGPTCLSGDVIGDYRLKRPLKVGDRVRFCDMAIYSMVKTNTFNGMKLPSIAYKESSDEQKEDIETIKEFSYDDFRGRL